ncbi:MAG: prephenate dehydrogenase/arogenate dehydrogenase family protein [Acidobacteriota bacterium]|nr:prephenate dehydrogenase/arogenate dehydrogenase family protein [Acidobacteriota bacterium]
MADTSDLHELRRRIQALDETIIEAAAERTRLAREVARVKEDHDLPTVDYAQEKRVLENARRIASEKGIEGDLAEDLLARLIRASVGEQEVRRLRHAATGEGQSAVVIGGAGRMGRWMVRFLQTQRFQVQIVDPAAPEALDRAGRALLPSADWILCATPPGVLVELYRSFSMQPPKGLVCDIASIKSPLIGPIGELRSLGVRVGSFHPMFGPAAVVLRDEDVVVCDTGDADALEAVQSLFAPTSARLFLVDLDEHDRLMAEVLALAHATTMAFSVARASGEAPQVHSTSYKVLEDLATLLAAESADVYFEIQADNPFAGRALQRLAHAIERIERAVKSGDRPHFARLMKGELEGSS